MEGCLTVFKSKAEEQRHYALIHGLQGWFGWRKKTLERCSTFLTLDAFRLFLQCFSRCSSTNGVHLFQVQDGLPESVAVVKAQEGDDAPGPEQGKEV